MRRTRMIATAAATEDGRDLAMKRIKSVVPGYVQLSANLWFGPR